MTRTWMVMDLRSLAMTQWSMGLSELGIGSSGFLGWFFPLWLKTSWIQRCSVRRIFCLSREKTHDNLN